jgi:hypothetical protein
MSDRHKHRRRAGLDHVRGAAHRRGRVGWRHLAGALIANAGDAAGWRYVEFFTANIRNPNTWRAYARACSRFFAWCDARGLTLTTIRHGGYWRARRLQRISLRIQSQIALKITSRFRLPDWPSRRPAASSCRPPSPPPATTPRARFLEFFAATIRNKNTRMARATGITAYLEAGGTLENAQAMAAHESPRTTKLYDRTGDEITLDVVERIAI